MCNKTQVTQVIVNLINNGCDAIKGSESPWIRVEREFKDNFHHIHVIDSGKGIPEDIKAKLFETYFSTKKHNGGSGIGLSIVSDIARNHLGRIEITEKEGHTCFTFSLPA